jgi:hypothetical protein
VIERLAASGAAVSIDSRRSTVIEAALAAGAHIVNDVSALRHDPRSIEILARSGVPVVLMHAPGGADDLHADGAYADVVLDVFDDLRERRDAALAAGIAREDPARSRHRLWQDAGGKPRADQRAAAVPCSGPADPVRRQPQAHDRARRTRRPRTSAWAVRWRWR